MRPASLTRFFIVPLTLSLLMAGCSVFKGGNSAKAGNNANQPNMSEDQRAQQLYDQSVKQDPDNVWKYSDERATNQQAEAYQDLIKSYNDAIAKSPELSWYYAARANAERSLKHFDEAIRDYDRAIAIDGDIAWYYAARAEAKMQKGMTTEAIRDYNQAIQIDPNQERFREALNKATNQ
jgi:tetratricopeptide (TPR) repeat protein